MPCRGNPLNCTELLRILDAAGFDAFIKERCAAYYAPVMERLGLAPGRYCRLLLLGYFEGLDSERAIAWRAADSMSRTHEAVCTWFLQRLADTGLVKGTTVGIDATTLEVAQQPRACDAWPHQAAGCFPRCAHLVA